MRSFRSYAILAGALGAAGILAVGLSADRPAGAGTGRAAGSSVAPAGPVAAPGVGADASQGRGAHAFYFTRGIYSDWRGSFRSMGAWATDYPKADQQFLTVLRRLTNLDAYASEHAVRLADPELRRYPFLYMVEVGYMDLRPEEAKALRDYLLAGGFLFVDDFWGTRQWQNFEEQMRHVLPEYPIRNLPLEHPIFRTFYEIREILQVPAIGNIRRGRTWEQDGFEPAVLGIFDERGRLLVMINWNTDLGDAWEWAEQPDYPLKFSTFAYQMGVNAIVYAMSN
ncbi:hypothetical protein BH23ACI1_BH23ACI1_09180 [soil metagenome]